ncbi:MAG: CDP-glycerol glycerophosphotransferase family protein, partial [Actinomycetota bacterium]|nr:CDP-glycerol glycerophosphotransferase family protein [Actinomycetota bacterium]
MIAKFKVAALNVLQRNAGLRRQTRRARTVLLGLRYRMHARAGIDPRLVVFESFGGRSYAGSPRAIYAAMLRDPRFAEFRFAWAFRGFERTADDVDLDDARTQIVQFGSADYYRAFGRARVWITNSIVAPELVPGQQLYVQTWHGTGIKRIGLDVPDGTAAAMNGKAEIDERYRIEAAKISIFVSPAPFGTEVFSSAFGLPATGPRSPFAEVGNPRNDALVLAGPAKVAAARARFGIADGVRALLYAPTFRDDDYAARSGYGFRLPFDLDALYAALAPTHVLLFRTHYLVSSGVDFGRYNGFVRDVSAVSEVNDVLLASDLLITDYSSVCFDYSLLDRPI